MNVDFLSMDRTEARKKYLQYLKAVKQRQTKEYETLKKTYRQLSLGNLVLDINAAFRKAGCDHKGHPRIAMARAHKPWCAFRRWENAESQFISADRRGQNLWNTSKRNLLVVADGLLPGHEIRGDKTLWAMVPTIPIAYQPATNLHNYHLLFEPEWEVVPPIDPILLKHLGGPMYVVCAQWDLTDIERAVLFDSRVYD